MTGKITLEGWTTSRVSTETPNPAQLAKQARVQMHCKYCGGTNVLKDAWAEWDTKQQAGVLNTSFCEDCEGPTRAEERPLQDAV